MESNTVMKCQSCSFAGTRFCDTCEENPNGRSIKIRSSRFSDFASNIVVDGVRYHVQTEIGDPKNPVITTSVVKDGEIISSKQKEYGVLSKDADWREKAQELMQQQHLSVINMLKAENPRERRAAVAYIEGVEALLKENDPEGALRLLGDALIEYPFSPFLLSYYGYLDAVVNSNYESGIDLCRTAIEILREDVAEGIEGLFSLPYRNLGMACLAAGAKKEAAEAFTRGLQSDPENPGLLREAERLGIRRKPIVPLLKRSNPINKYGGLLLYKSHLLQSSSRR